MKEKLPGTDSAKRFPKGNIVMKEEKPDYESPGRSIIGIIDPDNSRCLVIDFVPEGVKKEGAEDFPQVKITIKTGLSDFFDFLERLGSDPRLKNVGLIYGYTNSRMADFAVRRLGFCYSDYSEGTSFQELIGVVIDRDRLLKKLPWVKQKIKEVGLT